MSASKLRKAEPKYRRSYTSYTDENYIDLHNNRWIVKISGEANAVRAMVEKGRILLDAEPVDEYTWKQAVKNLQAIDDHSSSADRVSLNELPSLETYGLLIRSQEHEQHLYWRIHYEVHVPIAGNSTHFHEVNVGSDAIANVDFTAARSEITVRMGGVSAKGLTGKVSWATSGATLALWVHEDGTEYRFSNDAVTPPS